MESIKFILNFNIKKESEDLGIPIWQAPSLLFLFMGVFIVIVMLIVYFLTKFDDSPEFLVLSECAVVIMILSVGNMIISNIEKMAEVNKMKSEFVTIASHQLKTPIAQINWELEILLSNYKKGLDKKQLDIIRTISQSKETMARLVNDLLDVAKIDQGKLVLNRDRVNMTEIIDSVVKNNEVLAKASNVEISVIKPEVIPEIFGDKKRIEVVTDNLVSNAVKYIRKKGFVEIKVESDEKNIIVTIKDNGMGIPDRQQGRVFQKFFRSDNAALCHTDGTGLGLYISKNIIEKSGGKMWFKSIEGLGSEFFFSLPKNG